jgi:hypothetical protein
VQDARTSFDALRRQASDLPSADELATLFRDLQATAEREGRTLSEVSSALGLAAARAGIEMGNRHIFDFYRQSLGAIRDEGLLRYLVRVSTPYVTRAGRHFHPGRSTYTDRFLNYLERRRGHPGPATKP